LAHSGDGATSWSETHVAGPFDASGLETRSILTGSGLSGRDAGFIPVFRLGLEDGAAGGTSDIFAARVSTAGRPPRSPAVERSSIRRPLGQHDPGGVAFDLQVAVDEFIDQLTRRS
jgi:hypothetical protein